MIRQTGAERREAFRIRQTGAERREAFMIGQMERREGEKCI